MAEILHQLIGSSQVVGPILYISLLGLLWVFYIPRLRWSRVLAINHAGTLNAKLRRPPKNSAGPFQYLLHPNRNCQTQQGPVFRSRDRFSKLPAEDTSTMFFDMFLMLKQSAWWFAIQVIVDKRVCQNVRVCKKS